MKRSGLLPFVLIAAACVPASSTPGPEQPPSSAVAPTASPRPPLVIEEGKLYLAILWHQHQPA